MSVNQINVVGNMGDDPKLNTTNNGTKVCNFSVAVNDKVYEKGEYVKKTLWFKVTVWGQKAEACARYLQKGAVVFVTGKLETDEWINRENVPQFGLKINASDVIFISGFKSNDEVAEGSSSEAEAIVPADDIPF